MKLKRILIKVYCHSPILTYDSQHNEMSKNSLILNKHLFFFYKGCYFISVIFKLIETMKNNLYYHSNTFIGTIAECYQFKSYFGYKGPLGCSWEAHSGCPTFEHFFQYLGAYSSNNIKNLEFQVVHSLKFICVALWHSISPLQLNQK